VAATAVLVLPWWVLIGIVTVGEELRPVDPATVGPLDGIGLAAGLIRLLGLPMLLVFAALLAFGHRVGRPVGPGGALLGLLRRLPALLMWVLLCGVSQGLLYLSAAAPALVSGLSLPGIAVSAVLVLLCLYTRDLDAYPDPARQENETTMAVQSLGAAAQNALLAAYDKVSRALGLPPVEGHDPRRRGAADISFVAPLIPGLDGLGPWGSGGHTPDEDINLNSLEPATARAAILMYRLSR
jgi:hypothetical protein